MTTDIFDNYLLTTKMCFMAEQLAKPHGATKALFFLSEGGNSNRVLMMDAHG